MLTMPCLKHRSYPLNPNGIVKEFPISAEKKD